MPLEQGENSADPPCLSLLALYAPLFFPSYHITHVRLIMHDLSFRCPVSHFHAPTVRFSLALTRSRSMVTSGYTIMQRLDDSRKRDRNHLEEYPRNIARINKSGDKNNHRGSCRIALREEKLDRESFWIFGKFRPTGSFSLSASLGKHNILLSRNVFPQRLLVDASRWRTGCISVLFARGTRMRENLGRGFAAGGGGERRVAKTRAALALEGTHGRGTVEKETKPGAEECSRRGKSRNLRRELPPPFALITSTLPSYTLRPRADGCPYPPKRLSLL